MKQIVCSATIVLLCLTNFVAQADEKALSAGFSFWSTNPDGRFGQAEDNVLELDDSSGLQSNYYFSYEHNYLYLPNFRLARTQTSNEATVAIDKTYALNNSLFRVASVLNASSRHTQVDALGYYEIFDNRTLELDLGLTIRQHAITAKAVNQNDSSEAATSKVSDTQILLYGAGRLNLPLLHAGAFVETNFLNTSNYDLETGLVYTVYNSKLVKTNLKVGVKKQSIEFDNLEGLYTQLDWESVFVGMDFHF